jgi:hypothetical protein
MTDENIVKCSICKAPMIQEELEIHECFTKTLVDIRYDTGSNNYYLYDGRKWYRWFPPTESQQRNKTTGESTEPNIAFVEGMVSEWALEVSFPDYQSPLQLLRVWFLQ